MSDDTLREIVRAENERRFSHALDHDEVDKIISWALALPPGSDQLLQRTFNDVGNAQRFVSQYANNVRYCPDEDKWLYFEKHHWHRDDDGRVQEFAKALAQTMIDEAQALPDKELRQKALSHAARSNKLNAINSMITLAQSDPRMVARLSELDREPMLLGVENGVIDLKTGQLREGRPEDLITRSSSVRFDPKARAPRFRDFMREITSRRPDIEAYLKRMMGYMLTGLTTEQVFFFGYGTGRNGKSTLVELVSAILGPQLSAKTPTETLMVQHHGRSASNDLARLVGIRLVTADEVADGKQLDEAQVKKLSGGDTIACRFLYQEYIEYKPQFKLLISGNYKPVIRGVDEGIWRRLQLIPFEYQVPVDKINPHLFAELMQELPGILAYAIAGSLEYQQIGLAPPAYVTAAGDEFRRESDLFGQWFDERCEAGKGLEQPAGLALASYRAWTLANGHQPVSGSRFAARLRERGHSSYRSGRGNVYRGFRLSDRHPADLSGSAV